MIHNFLCKCYDRFATSSFYKGFQYFVFGDLEYRFYRISQQAIFTRSLHQKAFPQYKGIYRGQDVAVVACGPTAADFQPITGIKYIGVNRAYKLSGIALDYLFAVDRSVALTREEMHGLNMYRGDACQKFFGLIGDDKFDGNMVISEADAIEAGAHRFVIDDHMLNMRGYRFRFNYDIADLAIGGYGSTVFAALQFALWTNPRRIYLVGCDCSHAGHFDCKERNVDLRIDWMAEGYKALKKFAWQYYPDTEIISVNPVGLKGLFRDWYQKDGPLE